MQTVARARAVITLIWMRLRRERRLTAQKCLEAESFHERRERLSHRVR